MPKKPTLHRTAIVQACIILLWGVACMVFFQGFYHYHFFYQEQNQIFLLTGGHMASYLHHPAWLACLAGDFLTQFYYYLWVGPIILTLALLTVGDLARRALERAGLSRWWAFGIAIVLMTIEAVFCLKTTYRLSSVIALGGGLASYLLLSSCLKRGWVMIILTLLVGTLLTYWLFGYGVWALALLVLVDAICHTVRKDFLRQLFVRLFPLLLFPLLVYIGNGRLSNYYLTAGKALTYPGIGKFSQPDFQLEKVFAVDNEYHFGNWKKVEQLVESEERPNEMQLFFYNLVKAQKGELPDHLLRYTPNQLGTFYKIGPETPLLIINNMNELYWALGDMTLTERAAMMTNVFAPDNRNVRMMKRLAECNLVSGDTLAANKYLRILKHTWVYGDWADLIMRHEPKAWHYFKEKQQFVNKADTIRLTDNLHMVMMELLDSNPDNTVALDYILCSTLLLKDMDNFKRDYDRYCLSTGRPRLKPLYQQALMIYLAGTNAPEEEWKKYIVDQSLLQRFGEYNQHRGDSRFSDTYWYYFDTAKKPEL